MNIEHNNLRDRIKTVLAEGMSDDQLVHIFTQVVSTFDTLFPTGVEVTRTLSERAKTHGQYRMSLEALLEVLERHIASELRTDAYRATTDDLLRRVASLKKGLASRLKI